MQKKICTLKDHETVGTEFKSCKSSCRPLHTLCLTSERAALFSMFLLSWMSASCWASRSCCSVLLSLSGSVSSSLSRPSSSRRTCSFSLSRLSFTFSASFWVVSSFKQHSSASKRACWTCRGTFMMLQHSRPSHFFL